VLRGQKNLTKINVGSAGFNSVQVLAGRKLAARTEKTDAAISQRF